MMKLILFFSLITSASARIDFGYLEPEQQKYFANSSFTGNNQLERINLNVIEINKLHAMIRSLQTDIVRLKLEIEELKKKK